MLLAALSLNPRDLLESFGPWATIGLFLIIFAETGAAHRVLPSR